MLKKNVTVLEDKRDNIKGTSEPIQSLHAYTIPSKNHQHSKQTLLRNLNPRIRTLLISLQPTHKLIRLRHPSPLGQRRRNLRPRRRPRLSRPLMPKVGHVLKPAAIPDIKLPALPSFRLLRRRQLHRLLHHALGVAVVAEHDVHLERRVAPARAVDVLQVVVHVAAVEALLDRRLQLVPVVAEPAAAHVVPPSFRVAAPDPHPVALVVFFLGQRAVE